MAPAESHPDNVIEQFFQKRANTGHVTCQQENYILKVCGKEEYLLGDYPICQYKVGKQVFITETII